MDRYKIAREAVEKERIACLVQRLKELEKIADRNADQNEELRKCHCSLSIYRPPITYDVIQYDTNPAKIEGHNLEFARKTFY